MEASAYTHYAIDAHRAKNALGIYNQAIKMHLHLDSCINNNIILSVRKKLMQFLFLHSPTPISFLLQWFLNAFFSILPYCCGKNDLETLALRTSASVWIRAKNRRTERFQKMFYNSQLFCERKQACYAVSCSQDSSSCTFLPKDVISVLCSSANGWVRRYVERNRLKVTSAANSFCQGGDLIMWGLIRPSTWLFLYIKAVLSLRMWVPVAVITKLLKVLSIYSLLLRLCLLQICFSLITPPHTSWMHAPLCAWVIREALVRHRFADSQSADSQSQKSMDGAH